MFEPWHLFCYIIRCMALKFSRLIFCLFLVFALTACSKGGEQAPPPGPLPGPSPEPTPLPPPAPGPSPVPPVINQAPEITVDYSEVDLNPVPEGAVGAMLLYKEALPIEGLKIHIKDPDGDPVKLPSITPDTFQFSPIACLDQNLAEGGCYFTLIPPANVNDGDIFSIDIAATDQPKREGVPPIAATKKFNIKFLKEAAPLPLPPQNNRPVVTIMNRTGRSPTRVPLTGTLQNFDIQVKDPDGHPISESVQVQITGEPGSRNPPVNPAIFQFQPVPEKCNQPDKPGECTFILLMNGGGQDLFEFYRVEVSVSDVPPDGLESKSGSDFFNVQFYDPAPVPQNNRPPVITLDIDQTNIEITPEGFIRLPLFFGVSFGGFQIRVQDPDGDPINPSMVISRLTSSLRDKVLFQPLSWACNNPAKVGECVFDMILNRDIAPNRYNIKIAVADRPTGDRASLPPKISEVPLQLELYEDNWPPFVTLTADSNLHQFSWEIRSLTRPVIRDAMVLVSICDAPQPVFTVEYSGVECKVNNESRPQVSECLGSRTLDMTPYGSGRYCARIIAVDSAGGQVEASSTLEMTLPR